MSFLKTNVSLYLSNIVSIYLSAIVRQPSMSMPTNESSFVKTKPISLALNRLHASSACSNEPQVSGFVTLAGEIHSNLGFMGILKLFQQTHCFNFLSSDGILLNIINPLTGKHFSYHAIRLVNKTTNNHCDYPIHAAKLEEV